MQFSVISAFGFEDPDPGATLAAWAGLAGVGIAQAYRNPGAALQPEQMRTVASRAGVIFDSLHGVFGPEYDLSSPDESVRNRTMDAYCGEADFARKLGASIVVVHPSPQTADACDDRWRSTRLRQCSRSLDELSEVGDACGLKFLIENMPPGHPVGSDPAELARLVRNTRCGGLGICFDVAHAFLGGDARAGLAECGSLLQYVHASDNSGETDEHRLPFDGRIDWAGVGRGLAGIGYDGPFMLEVFLPAGEVCRQVTAEWVGRLRAAMGG
ncbi:MAG: sugar phosphate isomerase/epimerase [Phycisphaerae bacterium]|nr:sugar phosphate isomerase/epimerase [Phycisphaerae bacterium]